MSSFCRKLIFCSEVSVGFWLLASRQKVFAPECGFLLPGIALLSPCGKNWFEEVQLAVQELE